MINTYRDDTLEVVIHTANMQQLDWEEKTQGIWRSGRLSRLRSAQSADTIGSKFLADLSAYLRAYRIGAINDMVKGLADYDFSPVRAIFIGSVPGTYPKDSHEFGLQKLRYILKHSTFKANNDDYF